MDMQFFIELYFMEKEYSYVDLIFLIHMIDHRTWHFKEKQLR